MELIELLKERYSVRSYDKKPVEDEKLQKILEAGRLAPTAKDLQPQRIYVVKSEEKLQALGEVTKMTYGAPLVLVFAYDLDVEWHNPFEEGFTSGPQDVSIVATHMMLEAAELGLGTCWCGWFDPKEVRKVLDIPESHKLALIMPVGYPSENSVPSPRHSERYPLENTVKEI